MTNLRLAVRLALRQPMVSALAVVALALGIGLSTLMFSILNGAVLRVAVGVLLLATGLAAAFVPARRAARVEPMAAVRVQYARD